MATVRSIEGAVRSADHLPLAGLRVDVYRRAGAGAPGPSATDKDEEWVGGAYSARDGGFSVPLPSLPDDDDARSRPDFSVVVGSGQVSGDAGAVLARTAWRPEPLTIDDVIVILQEDELGRLGELPRRPVLTGPRTRGELATTGLNVAGRTRSSLFQATTTEVRRRVERRRRGGQIARRLMARRRAVGAEATTYVPPGSTPGDRLETVQRRGVERLSGLPSRGVRMHLEPEEFHQLFPDGSDGPITPPPWLVDQLDTVVGAGNGGLRLADLLTQCRANRAVDSFDPTPTEAAPPNDVVGGDGGGALPGVGAGEPFPLDVQTLLTQLLSADVTANLPTRPDPATVQTALASGPPPGPADTTAYYDFQRLQIAWEDVWTSALDDQAVTAVAAVYEQVVDTVDPEVLDVDGLAEVGELGELLDAISDAVAVATGTPGLDAPPEVLAWLPEVSGVWRQLSLDQQEWLRFLQWVDDDFAPWAAAFPLDFGDSVTAADLTIPTSEDWPVDWLESVHIDEVRHNPTWGLDTARTFLSSLDLSEGSTAPGLARLEGLLAELTQRLAEPYQFDLFVPGSYNYGLLTTIRQRWTPLEYQAGDLVASLPLAPGETREIETRQVIKTSRSQKEIEHSVASRSGESTTTGRAQAEIVRKAVSSTNFAMTAQGSVAVDYGPLSASLSGGHSFGGNQSADSAQTKQDLRESVARATQEYRDERSFEVSLASESSHERVERRTVSNSNNELTVTYLLYELQRRFEVAGRLHSARPVVMVAFEVPAPHEVTEAWLVAHEWILRRVILDDALLTALDELTNGFAGEELGVEVLRAQWDAQMRAVEVMRDNVELSSGVRDIARAALQVASSTVASRDGLIKNLGEALFPSGPEAEDVVTAQQEAAQRGLEWAMDDLVNQRQRLESAVTALERATTGYVDALRRRTDRLVAIDQLRLHVKDNILHYMQAVWAHEPPDQRFFRLYDLPAQWPARDTAALTVTPVRPGPISTAGVAGGTTQAARFADPPDVLTTGVPKAQVAIHYPGPGIGPQRPLHEVADLDELLGFRGNYAVFPLREGNAITDFMAQDFLDSYFGVNDPDPFGQMPSTSEALALAECAWNREGTTDEDRAEITRWLLDVMTAQGRVSQEVVVPTGQLFMEALPGSHPLLEDFKLAHRAADVERALADLRTAQVETLRRAARLAAGDLADPDVEQRVEVLGTEPQVSVDVPTTD